jgi:hypothetical protein
VANNTRFADMSILVEFVGFYSSFTKNLWGKCLNEDNYFWVNEAKFQMMLHAYNLFLLFKFNSLCISEYRQQTKKFHLEQIFSSFEDNQNGSILSDEILGKNIRIRLCQEIIIISRWY